MFSRTIVCLDCSKIQEGQCNNQLFMTICEVYPRGLGQLTVIQPYMVEHHETNYL